MTTDTVGGVWPYALELSRVLGTHGVEVVLATMGPRPSSEQRRETRQIPGLYILESEFQLPWMDDPWTDVAEAGSWLLDIARDCDPDLVHLNEPIYAALPWRVPTVAVAHSCVLSWWEAVHGQRAPPIWQRYSRAMRDGLTAANAVVVPSEFMRLAVKAHYGVAGARVIRNGRDPTKFRPASKEPIVFAAGRLWDRAKNLAALEIVAADVAWPIYVAGDTRHPGRDECVIASHLHLLGQMSARDVADWQARSAIYAFPARYEPFGLSILEAALAGCALVLGDLPSLRELWQGVAIFVDSDRPDTLRVGLDTLINDERLRTHFAESARQRALALTSGRMAKAYWRVYAEVQRVTAVCES